jgi:serine/threonine protein kinase
VSKLTREAWRAYFSGRYAKAADLYKAAGEHEKALDMYLKQGDLRSAAEMQVALGRVSDAVDLLMQAGDPSSAAQLLERHRQYMRAAQIMSEAGNKVQASALALKGGNPVLAAQFLEQSGRFVEAGRLMMQEGHQDKALLLLEKALRAMPALSSLTASEQLQNRELLTEIARYFEQAEAYNRAAEIHESLGNSLAAAQCWEAAKNYSKAIGLYRSAGALDRATALAEKGEDTPLEVRAEALAARGDVEEAARLLNKAGLRDRAATLLEEAGNLAGAAAQRAEMGDFELAGNLYYRVQAYLPAAECFQQAHLHDMAKQCYLKAGDNASAARMAFESGAWEEAVGLAPDKEDQEALLARLQAIPEKPEDRGLLRVLKARLFMALEQPHVALACLEDLPPVRGEEELWRLYILGRALESTGQAGEALSAYKKVVALNVLFLDTRDRLEELSQKPAVREERYRRTAPLGADELGPWFVGLDGAANSPVLLHRVENLLDSSLIPGCQARLERVLAFQHPSVLTLRDQTPSGASLLLVYENFDGQPLTQWLTEGYKPTLFGATDKLRQVLEALSDAQKRGLAHQHLSPFSLFMDKEGRVKLHGFGLIRSPEDIKSTPLRDQIRRYLPPEASPSPEAGPGADLFSAGALFLHLLTGEPPMHLPGDETLEGLFAAAGVPATTRNVVSRLLAADPAARYVRAEDALRDLSAQEMPAGSIIAGRYEILEELGRGGMGHVFRVKDRELDEVVALKTLRNRPDMSEASRSRFLREIKLSRKITHPNVVRVFDMGTWRDLSFLTMEYIPGRTLSQWVREGEGKRANLRQKVEILKGIAAGLFEAHKLGIIHRDLKPQNVILTPTGVPKLLDFGIAYVEVDEGNDLTQEGHFVGSPKYVSPEQVQGQPLSARSDIYCLGLLAYFLLTGQDAFTGDTPMLILLKQLKEQPTPPSKLSRLPPSLEGLVMKCLRKKPEERPGGLEEVMKSLQEIV